MQEPTGFNPSEFDAVLNRLRQATRDRYDISAQLGRGGMALVVAARDLSLGRKVAIKILLNQDSMPDAIERFHREAQLAASLSHPSIVPIYSIEHYEDIRFFVMKYIEGQSFDAALRSDGAQSPELVQILLEDIGSALDHAHSRGVVHRDLKPANIMLDQDGWAVLMDFGIAKAKKFSALTHTGLMVGTPAYLAPEYFSDGTYDARADQYAMGVLLFELLTNRKPFLGASPAELMKSHLLDSPPDLASLRTDCHAELVAVVSRMLSKKPEDRFSSFKDAVAILKPLTVEDQVAARKYMKELATRGAEQQPKMAELVGHATPRTVLRSNTAEVAVSVTGGGSAVDSSEVSKLQRNKLGPSFYRSIFWATAGAGVILFLLVLFRPPAPITISSSSSPEIPTTVVANVTSAQPSAVERRTVDVPGQAPTTREITAFGPKLPLPKKALAAKPSDSEAPIPILEVAPPNPSVRVSDTLLSASSPSKGWISVGSKKPTAALYANGKLILVLSGMGLKYISLDAGTIPLEIRADGCAIPWKENVRIKAGDTVFLKYLSPTACDSISLH